MVVYVGLLHGALSRMYGTVRMKKPNISTKLWRPQYIMGKKDGRIHDEIIITKIRICGDMKALLQWVNGSQGDDDAVGEHKSHRAKMEAASTQAYYTESGQVSGLDPDPHNGKECTRTKQVIDRQLPLHAGITDTFVLLNYGVILIPNGIYKMISGWDSGFNLYLVTFTYLTEAARIFNQRYIGVCLPHHAKKFCTVKLVNITVAISYVLAFIYFVSNFYIYQVDTNTHRFILRIQSVAQDPMYQILYSIVGFSLMTYIIPVTTLGFMSIQIIQSMKRVSNSIQASQSASSVRKDLTNSSIAIVVVSYPQPIV
ncbi:hypothetical protein CAPTEDRAFT_209371 [Capitella teleta]|uniref:G-protein coupled receptors family 1 profile domain-containing protein n=1 Tax=Capitella teleta TaxID=283909 RepID=R7TUK8_CAPTE|nr:hypothetical protein CAPTEDRAFT_209371 [Capitella teleta]|eukprot:ELT94710.1 hypothetical protein CAPTEDRAFT_209371 [Capitella teleta]